MIIRIDKDDTDLNLKVSYNQVVPAIVEMDKSVEVEQIEYDPQAILDHLVALSRGAGNVGSDEIPQILETLSAVRENDADKLNSILINPKEDKAV